MNLQLEPDEAVAAGKGFQNTASLLGRGMMFEKLKYFVLQADDERIIGKQGPNGFFIYKTGQGLSVVIVFVRLPKNTANLEAGIGTALQHVKLCLVFVN